MPSCYPHVVSLKNYTVFQIVINKVAPTSCVHNLLDTQVNVSYAADNKKQVLINQKLFFTM